MTIKLNTNTTTTDEARVRAIAAEANEMIVAAKGKHEDRIASATIQNKLLFHIIMLCSSFESAREQTKVNAETLAREYERVVNYIGNGYNVSSCAATHSAHRDFVMQAEKAQELAKEIITLAYIAGVAK